MRTQLVGIGRAVPGDRRSKLSTGTLAPRTRTAQLNGGSRHVLFTLRTACRYLPKEGHNLAIGGRIASEEVLPSSPLTIDVISVALSTCAEPTRLVGFPPHQLSTTSGAETPGAVTPGRAKAFCLPRHNWITRRLRAEPRERRCSSRPVLPKERKGVATTKKTGRDPSAPRPDVPTSRSGQPFRHRFASRMQ